MHVDPYPLGVQSFSFRHFSLDGAITQLKALGLEHMEFCAIHIPPDGADPNFQLTLANLRASGVITPSFGVEDFTRDKAANRRRFEFAKALDADIITAHPEPDAFEDLEALCEEFDMRIAIHNHGPEHRYNRVDDVAHALEGRSARIGACVDTGHFIRSGEQAHKAIERFGERVFAVHLKDWRHDGDEAVLGEGGVDLEGVAAALANAGFSGTVMLEYEAHPDDPVPHMRRGLDNWREAMAAVR